VIELAVADIGGTHARFAKARVDPRGDNTTQLRYRSEMADLFLDLAIDVGLRQDSELAPAA